MPEGQPPYHEVPGAGIAPLVCVIRRAIRKQRAVLAWMGTRLRGRYGSLCLVRVRAFDAARIDGGHNVVVGTTCVNIAVCVRGAGVR